MRRVLVVAAAVLALVAGYGALDAYDLVPGVLTLAPEPDPPAPTPTPSASPVAMPTIPTPSAAATPPAPSIAGVSAALAPALADPALKDVALSVRDAATGARLIERNPDVPRIPASTIKLVSALAVHRAFAAQDALVTRVVSGAAPSRVVLVAGGDTLLSPMAGDPAAVSGRAGLADLADQAAKSLRDKGIASVTLGIDQSYAPGPPLMPSWPPALYATGLTDKVSAIGLATGRAVPGAPGAADPATAAAQALVARLSERGIAAVLEPVPATAAAGAQVLGEVRSAPVGDVLARALRESDNALTESLARQAAFRVTGASDPAAVATYLVDTLRTTGLDVTGVRVVDASGLSRDNQVPARVIADVVSLGASGRHAGLAATLRELPVAGLDGTLAGRFAEPTAAPARGVVRAKTGTLTGVSALAGTVVTADNRPLVLVAIEQGSAGTPAARAALDRIGAILAGCGCR